MSRAALAALALVGCGYAAPPFVGDAGLDLDSHPGDDAAPPDAASVCVATDCDSQVCLDGSCVPADLTRYVSVAGVDNPTCYLDQPCKTITHAIAVASANGVVAITPGDYVESVSVGGGVSATLVGIGGSGAVTLGANSDALTVQNGGALRVVGLDLEAAGASGVRCIGPAAVTLEALTIASPRRHGVDARDCDVRARQVAIVGATLQGLELVRGQLELRSSSVIANVRGGARLRDGVSVAITGSVFARNGAPTIAGVTGSPFGGLDVTAADGRVVGNTIVDNRAANVGEAAIVCDNNTQLTLENNLVTSLVDFTVSCGLRYSVFMGATAFPPTENRALSVDPFVSQRAGDYHLRAPLASTAPPPLAGELDLDGQPRPQGALDVGADEVP